MPGTEEDDRFSEQWGPVGLNLALLGTIVTLGFFPWGMYRFVDVRFNSAVLLGLGWIIMICCLIGIVQLRVLSRRDRFR